MDQERAPALNIQPLRRRKFTPAETRVVDAGDSRAAPVEPASSEGEAQEAVSSSLHVRRRIRQLQAQGSPETPAHSSLHVRRRIRQLQAKVAPSSAGEKITPRLHPALQDIEMQETGLLIRPLEPPGRPEKDGGSAVEDAQHRPAAPLQATGNGSKSPAARETSLEAARRHVVLYRQANFYVSAVCRAGQTVAPLRKPSGHTARMPQVMPRQRERVAASETRRMPQVEVRETARTLTLPVPLWLEIAVVLLLLAGSVVLHAYNLFAYPAYTADEGTYMQNAWAVTLGRLTPYPYGYGHPPAGWMQIALWLKLAGIFSFGEALNGGRVLMLVYAAASTLLVYLIVRRLGGSQSAALVGMAVFAFSPLGVLFQREVLLDNIATFWLLLSLALIVSSRSRLPYLIGAALALGLAVLSKEVIAVCLPAMVYAAWLHITPFQRKFALVAFLYITLALISTFVLMALLKGEFFPYAWHLPWDNHPHLSLLDTYIGQVQRSQSQGSLLGSWYVWFQDDAPLLIAGVAAPAFNLLYGWWRRQHLLAGLLAASYWALLARGGVAYPFYLIPLLPLMALNVALALHALLGGLSWLIHLKPARAVLLLLLLSLLLPYDAIGAARQASANPVSAQQQALSWIGSHVPRKAYIVISPYLYLDLRLPGGEGVGSGSPFPNAEVYWEVATDPAVRDRILHDDWNTIDYLVVDDQMLKDIMNNAGQFGLLQQALEHSKLLVSFRTQDRLHQTTLWIYQVQHDETPLV